VNSGTGRSLFQSCFTLDSCQCCVVSGSEFWDGPITLPEMFYAVCLCVCVCVCVCAIECVCFIECDQMQE